MKDQLVRHLKAFVSAAFTAGASASWAYVSDGELTRAEMVAVLFVAIAAGFGVWFTPPTIPKAPAAVVGRGSRIY